MYVHSSRQSFIVIPQRTFTQTAVLGGARTLTQRDITDRPPTPVKEHALHNRSALLTVNQMSQIRPLYTLSQIRKQ